jgi:predicted acetyltransferase
MPVEIRALRPGEELAFVRSTRVPFLAPLTDERADQESDERNAGYIEVDRAWVADDGGRFVGNACNYTMDVTIPAAPGRTTPVIPMAGVSAVGVHPTHRRRGLLTGLMARILDDARRRDEPVAGLIASESIIYGRYGFGLATDMAEWTINTRETAFATPAPAIDIRLVDSDEAVKVLPEIFDRQRRSRAGEPGRSDSRWQEIHEHDRRERDGAGAIFTAVCDDGYVRYRVEERNVLRAERCTVLVEELRGCTPEVEAGLWRFLFDLDLVGVVRARRRPVDEPLRWRLTDLRQLRVQSVDDRLYLRLLDVPAAFEARGYQAEGRVVLDVLPAPAAGARPPGIGPTGTDPACGRWVLDAGPDGASCRPAPAGEAADLRLGVTALGSLYMGGVPASLLAGAGQVEELTGGSLDAADRLLSTGPAPLTGTGF